MPIETSRFLSLSYHYIRPPKEKDPFPRILGTTIAKFKEQIEALKKRYLIISPQDVQEFYYSGKCNWVTGGVTGLLLTFDDGLSDHYVAAKILNGLGIRAFFFIPTCITEDLLPANPNIIHYCLAKYGIAAFLDSFNEAAGYFGIKVSTPQYNPGDDVWKTISAIKKMIKYHVGAADSRKILLQIYASTFARDYKNAFGIIHLTRRQISEIIAMGHSIGSHSHSHVSAASANLSNLEIEQEIVTPRLLLEKRFGVKVNALSYPFGEQADCLTSRELIGLTRTYDLAFTIEEKANTLETSPLELGRYMPTSKDTTEDICNKLSKISGIDQ